MSYSYTWSPSRPIPSSMLFGAGPKMRGKDAETRRAECNQIAKQTDGTLHFKGGARGLYPSGTLKKKKKKKRGRKLFKCPRASAAVTVKKQSL